MSHILLQQQFLYKLEQSTAVIRDGLHGFPNTWKDLPDFCCDLQSSEQAVCLHSESGVKNYYCDLLEVRFVNTRRAGMLDQIHRWECGRAQDYSAVKMTWTWKIHIETQNNIDQDFCLNLNTHLSSHLIRPLVMWLWIYHKKWFLF